MGLARDWKVLDFFQVEQRGNEEERVEQAHKLGGRLLLSARLNHEIQL